MKIVVYDTKQYDKAFFEEENAKYGFDIKYLESKLTPDTARLASGYDAVCAFVNDDIGAATIDALVDAGVRAIAMRCAGYNNVDMKHAFGKIHIVGVPRYSPYAVAEHGIADDLKPKNTPRLSAHTRRKLFSQRTARVRSPWQNRRNHWNRTNRTMFHGYLPGLRNARHRL